MELTEDVYVTSRNQDIRAQRKQQRIAYRINMLNFAPAKDLSALVDDDTLRRAQTYIQKSLSVINIRGRSLIDLTFSLLFIFLRDVENIPISETAFLKKMHMPTRLFRRTCKQLRPILHVSSCRISLVNDSCISTGLLLREAAVKLNLSDSSIRLIEEMLETQKNSAVFSKAPFCVLGGFIYIATTINEEYITQDRIAGALSVAAISIRSIYKQLLSEDEKLRKEFNTHCRYKRRRNETV